MEINDFLIRTFLNKIINFMGVGFALYALASVAELVSEDPIIKHTVKCKYCRKRINAKALRCINCTSKNSSRIMLILLMCFLGWVDGRDDGVQDRNQDQDSN